jgi:hypothetical protein
VALPPPRVLLRCGGEADAWRAAELAPDVAAAPPLVWEARLTAAAACGCCCVSGTRQWTEAMHALARTRCLQVPAGNTAHTIVVERVTAASGVAGALLLLWRLHTLPPVARHDGAASAG